MIGKTKHGYKSNHAARSRCFVKYWENRHRLLKDRMEGPSKRIGLDASIGEMMEFDAFVTSINKPKEPAPIRCAAFCVRSWKLAVAFLPPCSVISVSEVHEVPYWLDGSYE